MISNSVDIEDLKKEFLTMPNNPTDFLLYTAPDGKVKVEVFVKTNRSG